MYILGSAKPVLSAQDIHCRFFSLFVDIYFRPTRSPCSLLEGRDSAVKWQVFPILFFFCSVGAAADCSRSAVPFSSRFRRHGCRRVLDAGRHWCVGIYGLKWPSGNYSPNIVFFFLTGELYHMFTIAKPALARRKMCVCSNVSHAQHFQHYVFSECKVLSVW